MGNCCIKSGDVLEEQAPKKLVPNPGLDDRIRDAQNKEHSKRSLDASSLSTDSDYLNDGMTISVGAFSCQNAAFRRHMEDRYVVKKHFRSSDEDIPQSFVGVYDGHGGEEIAEIAAAKLHAYLSKEIDLQIGRNKCDAGEEDSAIRECFINAYKKVEMDALRISTFHDVCGSTAVTCLIRKTSWGRKLYVANVGDSSLILCRNGKAVKLSVDHRPSNPEESNRIEAAGGFILNGRVNGILSVTRSLGHTSDGGFVLGIPAFNTVKLSPSDSFIVISSDGLTDSLSDQQIVDFVNESFRIGLSAAEASRELVSLAQEEGAHDNLTAIIVRF